MTPRHHGPMERPTPSSPEAQRRMRAVRRRDTAPEMALRRALHRRGHRYRVDMKLPGLRRRADIVFTRAKVAVFVDGCFWHGCAQHGTAPKSNADFWANKISTNRARDRDTDERLEELGWRAVRVWEHEDVEAAVEVIESALAGRTHR